MKSLLLLYATFVVFIFVLHGKAEVTVLNFNQSDLQGWEKVVLVYFHDFPHQHKNLPGSPDCFFVPDLSAASYSVGKSIWRCRERISLLRPDTFINRWKREQDINGAVDFSLPCSGINHVAAYIESVSSIEHNTLPVSSDSAGSEVVTGIFLRHSMNVRTYTFESIATGQLSKINATPEHRFYVKNRHAWIPLYKIEAGMIMTDKHNQPVRLLCSNDQRGHCGVPLHPGEITTIYNLEVYKKHVYFAGRRSLLVHNMYYDDIYPERPPDSLQAISIRKLAQPFVSTSYKQMLKELFQTKINSCFDGSPPIFFRGEIDKLIKSYNQRVKNCGLVPYELGYEYMLDYVYTATSDETFDHMYRGLIQFYFKHPDYLYKSDYLESTYGPFGEMQTRRTVDVEWNFNSAKGAARTRRKTPGDVWLSTEEADISTWNLHADKDLQVNIRNFEEYSQLVQPYLSAFGAREFKSLLLQRNTGHPGL